MNRKRFQSLIGKLQTYNPDTMYIFLCHCFNPLQVSYKRSLLQFSPLSLLWFQSLIGKLQTRIVLRKLIYERKFQSLIGKLQTKLFTLWNDYTKQFQSLIGKLQTGCKRTNLPQNRKSFNPLQVSYKHVLTAYTGAPVLSFNPLQVSYKLVLAEVHPWIARIVSIPYR